MNTFDASSPTGSGDQPAHGGPGPAVGSAVGIADEPSLNGATALPMNDDDAFVPDSLLDQIAAEVAERDQEYAEPWEKVIPHTSLKLICDPRIEHDDFERWRRSSMPKPKRRGAPAAPSPVDMNQLMMSARALIAQNIRIDVLNKRTGEYRPLVHEGEELVLDSDALLRKFNVMDPVLLLRKLFGRDGDVIDAGMELLTAAGYMGGDDDEDPTEEPVGVRRKRKR